MTNTSGEPAEPTGWGGSRTLLIGGTALMLIWFVALASLAWMTANPITVNQRQVRRADLVIVGRVIDRERGAVELVSGWSEDGPDGEIAIDDLSETAAVDSRQYVFPLWKTPDDRYKIVRVRGMKAQDASQAMIYPYSTDVDAQVRDALALGRIDE